MNKILTAVSYIIFTSLSLNAFAANKYKEEEYPSDEYFLKLGGSRIRCWS